jgi:hypothetical protein
MPKEYKRVPQELELAFLKPLEKELKGVKSSRVIKRRSSKRTPKTIFARKYSIFI